MPRRHPEFIVRPNTKGEPRIGIDIESGFTTDTGMREVHLRFVALDADGLVDPDAETLFHCNLNPETARNAGAVLARMAG